MREQPDDLFSGLFGRIVAAGAMTGFVLGVLCRGLIVGFAFLADRQGWNRFLCNAFTGGVAGGLMTGLIMGPLLGWSFGRLEDYSLIATNELLVGALVGAAALTALLRLYDRGYLTRWIMRDFLVLVLVGVIVAGLALILDRALDLYPFIEPYFANTDDDAALAIGGLVFGLVGGSVIGIIVGAEVMLQHARD